MLYQLSYSPRQLEIYSKVQARSLSVLRRLEPEVDRPPARDKRDRENVAPVERLAVDRNEVDLVLRVAPAHVTLSRRQPRALKLHLDDRLVLVDATPLALNAQ